MSLDPSPPARPQPGRDEELPDPALFWRWVGGATRPTVGWILAGVGVLIIILGWVGISGQAIVAKQLPYLISGGVGGMALVGVGAVLIGTERLRQDSGRLDRLENMMTELHAVLLAHPDAPDVDAALDVLSAASGPASGANGRATGSTAVLTRTRLVALPNGTTYHARDCSMVRGKDEARAVGPDAIAKRGLSACRLCEPLTPEA